MLKRVLIPLLLILVSTSIAQGSLGFIGNRGTNVVSVINTLGGGSGEGSFITDITVSSTPWDLVAISATNEVWVTLPSGNEVVIIDKFSLTVVATIDLTLNSMSFPIGIVTDGGTQVFVCARMPGGPGDAMVGVYDAVSRSFIKSYTFTGTGIWAYDAAFKAFNGVGPPGGEGELIVSDGSDEIWHVNLATDVTTQLFVGGVNSTTAGVDVVSDNDRVIVAEANGNFTLGPSVHNVETFFSEPPPLGPTIIGPGATGDSANDVVFGLDLGEHQGYVSIDDGVGAIGRILIDVTDAFSGPLQMTGYIPDPVSFFFDTDTKEKLYVGHSSTTGAGMEVYDVNGWTVGVPPTLLGTITGLPDQGAGRVGVLPANPAPTLKWHCPVGGPLAGGNFVYIQGTGFFGTPVVNIGAAASVVSVSSTDLTVIAPLNLAPGLQTITVQNPDFQTAALPNTYYQTLSPLTPDSININAGSTTADYQMVSFQHIVYEQIFHSGVLSAFGAYNPAIYRIFRWNENSQAYEEFSSLSPLTDCDITGKSIWVIARNGGSINVSGYPVGGVITICLAPGWNMISSPFVTASGLDNCTVDDDLLMAPAAVALTAGGNVLTDQFVYQYSGGSYVQIITGGAMFPNNGYWIRNLTSGIVYLTMDGVPKPGQLPGDQVSQVPAPGSSLPPSPPGGVGGASGGGGGGGCGPRDAGVLDPPVLFVVLILLFGLRRVRQVV